MAVVPHRSCVKGGEWLPHHLNVKGDPVWYTEHVTCSCEKGKKLHEFLKDKAGLNDRKRPCSLETYKEFCLPNPHEHVAEVDYRQRLNRGTLIPGNSMFDRKDVEKASAGMDVPS
jgi:hypothetical protein